jgi:hypothetical protein
VYQQNIVQFLGTNMASSITLNTTYLPCIVTAPCSMTSFKCTIPVQNSQCAFLSYSIVVNSNPVQNLIVPWVWYAGGDISSVVPSVVPSNTTGLQLTVTMTNTIDPSSVPGGGSLIFSIGSLGSAIEFTVPKFTPIAQVALNIALGKSRIDTVSLYYQHPDIINPLFGNRVRIGFID